MTAQNTKAFGAVARFNTPRGPKAVSVQEILEWAFRREKVQLDLPQAEEALIGIGYGIGSSLRLIRRNELGCRVDGGGTSTCHEDAEVVAAVLAGLPEGMGGRRFALQIAEWARMGTTPDWMPGAEPKVVPAIVQIGPNGGRPSLSVNVDPEQSGWPDKVRVCPVMMQPTAQQIAMSRRQYLQWHSALLELLVNLRSCGMLRRHVLTDVMPPVAPWTKSS